MGVLSASILNKINKILIREFGKQNPPAVDTKEVVIAYDEINNGNKHLVNLGQIPTGSTFIEGEVTINTAFSHNSQSIYSRMNIGINEEINYPITENYQSLIFDNYLLDTSGDANGSSTIAGSEHKLNNQINNIVAQFYFNGSWTVASQLNSVRRNMAGCGTQSAALGFGGRISNSVALPNTEKYNGSVWSNNSSWNLIQERYYLAGCGTQTAALSFGGYDDGTGNPHNDTESFNDITWTRINNLSAQRSHQSGCGTESAALCVGGQDGLETSTLEFDGTDWDDGGDLNTGRTESCTCGTQTAALCFGGYDPNTITTWYPYVEEYNGTGWTVGNYLNNNVNIFSCCGTQDIALGMVQSGLGTEEYDGIHWKVSNDLNNSQDADSASGTQTAGLAFGGLSAYTEEYHFNNLNDLDAGSLTLSLTYSY